MTPEQRRLSLETARRALQADDPQVLAKALASLPHDGEKAAVLRAQLLARLSVRQTPEPKPVTHAHKGSLKEGVRLLLFQNEGVVTIEHGGSEPLMKTASRGGLTEIRLNADHPDFPFLTRNGALDDATRLLLLGWATLEFDAGSERRRDLIRDMMTDWSRALAQIARSREMDQ